MPTLHTIEKYRNRLLALIEASVQSDESMTVIPTNNKSTAFVRVTDMETAETVWYSITVRREQKP